MPYRHRFPLSIIQHAFWLYHRFPLSERDVQELLHQRGIEVSHETLRQWNIKFAPLLTEELRHREPRRGSRWFLDEMCVEIGGRKYWLFLGSPASRVQLAGNARQARRTRVRRRSNLARAYICRFSSLTRVTCPSTWPLLQGEVIAPMMAERSF